MLSIFLFIILLSLFIVLVIRMFRTGLNTIKGLIYAYKHKLNYKNYKEDKEYVRDLKIEEREKILNTLLSIVFIILFVVFVKTL